VTDVTLQVRSGAAAATVAVVGAVALGGSRGRMVRWWQYGTTGSSLAAGTVKGARSRPPLLTVRTG